MSDKQGIPFDADDHAEAAALIRDRLAGQFGSSDTYPSKAAGYGVEGLMAIAGTLAEQIDQDVRDARTKYQGDGIADTYPGDWKLIAQANTATTFAVLALTQAVRDQTDAIQEVLALAMDMRREVPGDDQ